MAVLVSMRLWIMSRNRNVVASLKGKDGFSQLREAHSHCVRGIWLMRNWWCTALLAQNTACHSFTQLPQLTEELPGRRNVRSPFCFFLFTFTAPTHLLFLVPFSDMCFSQDNDHTTVPCCFAWGWD